MGLFDSILITGGGGMLAHALVEALRARGMNCHALCRSECDITQKDQVQAKFEQYRPTLVFNCAAHTGVDACEDESERAFAINGVAVGHLATICRQWEAKLVHYSTDFVFDGQLDRPYRPDDRPQPLSVYGSSKLAGEKYISQSPHFPWITIRTSWLFGKHGESFPAKMVELAGRGRPLRVVDDQWGSPTYTADLAAASLALLDREAEGIFHVTNTPKTTWFKFAQETLEVFGLSADLKPVSTAQWLEMRPKQATRPQYSVLDLSAYSEVTGKRPRDWRDCLREFHERLD